MKKTLSLLGFCLLAGNLASFGQTLPQPARPHSLSLSAEAVSVGGSTSSKDTTQSSTHTKDNGTYGMAHSLHTVQTMTSTTRESVQVTVHNFGVLPDNAHVEWYFVAMPVKLAPGSPGDQRFIFDHGTKDVTVAGHGTQAFIADSQEITSSVRRNNRALYRASGKINVTSRKAMGTTQSGSKIAGWVVRITADGRTLDTKGSSQDLETIAKDDAKLQALTAKDTGE